MSERLLSAVIRIETSRGQVAGAGFAVWPRGLVVTCAHVVNAALGLDPVAVDKPGGDVRLVFPSVDLALTGELVAWSPWGKRDVAVLRVQGDLPEGIVPIKLFALTHARERTFQCYGFPDGFSTGRYARGHLGDQIVSGQIEAVAEELTPGYSGGFVQELQMGRVVGMVSAVAKTGEARFLIPARTIHEVCADVELIRGFYPFSPLTDGLTGLAGNPLTG